MSLPTQEEIAIGETKKFVNQPDINRFNSYIGSFEDIVKPMENRAKECNMQGIIDEGHIAETAVTNINKEIVRMIYWAKQDLRSDVERLAKNFVDLRNRYKVAKDTLHYDCKCTKK